MAELSDRYRKGAEKFEEVYPGSASEDPNEFERNSMENLFSEYWYREGLSTRDRRLLILGIVAAQGNQAIQRLQFRAGIEKGDLTESDLTEIPIFVSQYAGFPLSVLMNQSAQKVAERLKD
jgi:4-carboxymuconolactone decarboxylase